MLRHRQARSRDHKSRSRRDVECLCATRSRPSGVDKTSMLRDHASGSRAQSFSHSGEFVNPLTLRGESHESAGNLRISSLRIKQRFQELESLIARQIFTTNESRKKIS